VTAPTELVFETHSLTTDNERGIATGWLGTPFDWQEGWKYELESAVATPVAQP
jgi:hypothetical protein